MPSDKDLDAAFAIADQDKNNAVDVFEFIRLCSLVAKGEVTGLGKGGAKSKKKFRGSMLGKGLTLQPGTDVTWKGADEDLPAGTVGKVRALTPTPHPFYFVFHIISFVTLFVRGGKELFS